MQQIAILTGGLWRLRQEIALMTGMRPVRWDGLRRPAYDAVAGWGHASTATRARRLAARSATPYIAFEDGPLRSVRPGPSQPPMSLVMDRSGIYYDSIGGSDLVAMAGDAAWYSAPVAERASAALARLRQLRLSKYNSGPERTPEAMGLAPRDPANRVLVLDQVRDDASVRGAQADAADFAAMLDAAIREHPSAEIVVKLHPDVLTGRRGGYFPQVAPRERLRLIAEPASPWSLLDAADTVYTVSSGMGFEAALAGKAVVCFGSPFYAGWGFTDDRRPGLSRPSRIAPLQLFAAYYLRYARYFDAYSRREIAFEETAEQLAWLRDRFHGQDRPSVCYRVTRWKRRPVDRMLAGPAGTPLHTASAARAVAAAKAGGGRVVAWASRDLGPLESACAVAGVPLVRAEDGFIRSAGLGASFVAPLSLVFDPDGIYFDSRRPSRLERILAETVFPAALVARASCLRATLVAAGTTKYNVDAKAGLLIDSGGRPVILVPGQVEDDASIRHGSPLIRRNVELLAAVRRRNPNAYIVYKPHPDVEAGFRRGRIAPAVAAELADQLAENAAIIDLIGLCDKVETLTSLAGFEALLRGKPVTTHGQPFYAGWGLTEDLAPVDRRRRRLSLDELVAAALILYPLYLDPVSGLPCGPELLVDRIAAAQAQAVSPRARMFRAARFGAARALAASRALQRMARGGA